MNLQKILRRRKFIVDRSLQLKLLLYSVAYILFYIVALGAGLFVPLMVELSNAERTSPEALPIATNFLYLHYHFWPVALLSIIVVALHSILTSHKIAGPLYRFRRVFLDLKEGTVPKMVNLRRGDLLQGEMQSINEMLDGIRTRVSEIQKTEELLEQSITECQGRAAMVDDAGLRKCIGELAERGELLAQATRTIHVIR